MDKCGKCAKTVYPTEKVNALGKTWHKACFKCNSCSATIQLGTEQNHDGMPYCKRCHQANFGPGGYGFGALNSHKWNTDVHSAPSDSGGKFCGSCGAAASGGKFCAKCGGQL